MILTQFESQDTGNRMVLHINNIKLANEQEVECGTDCLIALYAMVFLPGYIVSGQGHGQGS